MSDNASKCDTCKYDFLNICGKINCFNCPMYENDDCKCLDISSKDDCPYYEENKDDE